MKKALTPEQRRVLDRIKRLGQAEGLLEAAEMARTVSQSLPALGAPEAAAVMAEFSWALGAEAAKRSKLVLEEN